MSDAAPASPVDAWESLFRAQVSVMRDLRLEFTDQGMTMNEYDVLFNVAREPGRRVRLRELNRTVLITQSSVSRLVDRLVARGLLDKCGDPDDARGAIVCLTPFGLGEFERAAKVHMRSITRRFATLDADELATLTAICGKLLPSRDADADADPDSARGTIQIEP